MHYILFLIICAIWGSSFILMDRAVDVYSPLGVAFWRVVSGAAILAVIALVRRQSLRFPRKAWRHVLFAGGVIYAWPYMLQPLLIKRGFPHGMMGMMVVFVPLLTILVSIPLLKIKPTGRQMLGVAGGLACIGIIAVDTQTRGISFVLLLFAISSPSMYAFGNTYVKRFLQGTPILPLTFWSLSGSALTFLILGLISNPAGLVGMAAVETETTWLTATAAALVLGVFATGIAMLLFNYLIIHQGPLFAGMVTYIVPFGAVLLGYLDGEPITTSQILALVGTLVMVALVQYRSAKTPQPKPVLQTAGSLDNE